MVVNKQRIEQVDTDDKLILGVDVEHICDKDTISLMRYEIRLKQDKDTVILNADMIKAINKIINRNYKEIVRAD